MVAPNNRCSLLKINAKHFEDGLRRLSQYASDSYGPTTKAWKLWNIRTFEVLVMFWIYMYQHVPTILFKHQTWGYILCSDIPMSKWWCWWALDAAALLVQVAVGKKTPQRREARFPWCSKGCSNPPKNKTNSSTVTSKSSNICMGLHGYMIVQMLWYNIKCFLNGSASFFPSYGLFNVEHDGNQWILTCFNPVPSTHFNIFN